MKELVSGDRLKAVLAFTEVYLNRLNRYKAQTEEFNTQLLALRQKLTVLELNLRKRGEEAAATKSASSTTTFQKAVKITYEGVSGISQQSVRLILSYLVSNASWEPIYHLRVSVPEHSGEDAKPLVQVPCCPLTAQCLSVLILLSLSI